MVSTAPTPLLYIVSFAVSKVEPEIFNEPVLYIAPPFIALLLLNIVLVITAVPSLYIAPAEVVAILPLNVELFTSNVPALYIAPAFTALLEVNLEFDIVKLPALLLKIAPFVEE